jgi:cyclophilin family peptidyl-prolyl cis-trans isomerase
VRWQAERDTALDCLWDSKPKRRRRFALPAHSKTTKEKNMANRIAVIQTNKGTIRFELLETEAPKTTENFITLAERGYYDGIIFHRVIDGFMIQGGDPTGTGSGGKSAWGGKFDDEIDRSSDVYKRGYKAGTVAMANAGPNTNGSQFFIMHVDYPLPPSYSIFGQVIEGQDIVNAIATTDRDRNDRPRAEVKMEKVTIEST